MPINEDQQIQEAIRRWEFVAGKLILRLDGQEARLVTRHHPRLAAVWCYGIIMVILYVAYRGIPAPERYICVPAGALIGLSIATIIVAAEYKCSRFPAVIVFDRVSQTLTLPRINSKATIPVNGAAIAVQPVEIRSSENAHYSALYLTSDLGRNQLFFLNPASNSAVHRFAEACGLAVTMLPKLTINQ